MRAPLNIVSVLLVAGALQIGCRAPVRRFPLAAPRWQDPDRANVPRMPGSYYSGLYGDAVDKQMLRPLSQLMALPTPGESINVNAMDEVPRSAWFQNRIGLFPGQWNPGRVAQGACASGPNLDPARGPWLVTAAKTKGITPGFFIKWPGGHRYLLKMDGFHRPERGSSADVVGSRVYHAAGYNTPCNQVVFFRRGVLKLAPDATAQDEVGGKRPLSADEVDDVLARAFRLKDGRLRALASRFLPGKPLGPFRYEGVREDDPNDVIPHEERRELRAARLLAAWLNHWDIREENSLDMWVREGGRQFVRHYQLDFGDSFGGLWTDDRLDRRLGHAYYFDTAQIALDFLSLGAVPRPWYHARINEEAEIFGYFSAKGFVASRWKPVYPNPAFARMTMRDALWAVRIISRFSDGHIRAIVRETRLRDRRAERYLARQLIGRRDRLLREYLTRYVPLDRFQLVRRTPGSTIQSLCFQDLAIAHAWVPHDRVVYKVRMMAGRRLERLLGWVQFRPDPDHPDSSCVQLPVGDRRPAELAPKGSRDDHPLRYGVLRFFVYQRTGRRPTRLDVHLYDRGARRGLVLVGLERFGNQRFDL